MIVAVGFNPRTTSVPRSSRVAERRAKPSAANRVVRSTIAPRREICGIDLQWVETHGYSRTSLRDKNQSLHD
jgi:hypothetical protein